MHFWACSVVDSFLRLVETLLACHFTLKSLKDVHHAHATVPLVELGVLCEVNFAVGANGGQVNLLVDELSGGRFCGVVFATFHLERVELILELTAGHAHDGASPAGQFGWVRTLGQTKRDRGVSGLVLFSVLEFIVKLENAGRSYTEIAQDILVNKMRSLATLKSSLSISLLALSPSDRKALETVHPHSCLDLEKSLHALAAESGQGRTDHKWCEKRARARSNLNTYLVPSFLLSD